MSSQSKFLFILAILIVVLLIGGGVIGFLYWQNSQTDSAAPEASQELTNKNNNNNANVVVEENVNKIAETETAEVKEINDEDFLQQLAKSFSERYGSFSNQNDYENLLDLKIYMTSKMQGEVDDFIAANKAEVDGSEVYYGITTKVLTTKKISLENDKAEYNVTCQRKESKGLEGGNNTYTEQAKIEFKKVDSQWKVHSFTWF